MICHMQKKHQETIFYLKIVMVEKDFVLYDIMIVKASRYLRSFRPGKIKSEM